MPRGPRVDVENALYHVIARGTERRAIFVDDRDRIGFLRRLGTVVHETGLTLFAYVLMDNHLHLVVRRSATTLGHSMHRLLTGHAVAFNRRHRRSGHLFQNRFKAILCAEDPYLLQLVRYVHLNPVRARIVGDPGAYPWSSHHAYLARRPPPWLDVETVLSMLGGRRAYRRFCAADGSDGDYPELTGRASDSETGSRRLWLGRQVLGDENLARATARRTRRRELEREMERGNVADLPAIASCIASALGVEEAKLQGLLFDDRTRGGSATRSRFIRTAVLESSSCASTWRATSAYPQAR